MIRWLFALALVLGSTAPRAQELTRLLDYLPASSWGERSLLAYADLSQVEQASGLDRPSASPADWSAVRRHLIAMTTRLRTFPGPLRQWLASAERATLGRDPLQPLGIASLLVDRVVAVGPVAADGVVLLGGAPALSDGRSRGELLTVLAPGLLGPAVAAGPTLAEIPDLAAAVAAVERRTPVEGVLLQAEAIARLPGFGQRPARAEPPMPQPGVILIADRVEADRSVGLLALTYPDAATAELAATILAARLTGDFRFQRFLERNTATLEVEVVPVADRVVLLAGLAQPTGTAGDTGYRYWQNRVLISFNVAFLEP